MLDKNLQLKWGSYPQLVFNNYNELFEALGEISNPKYCSIHFEENSRNGSYSDVFRVVFKINPKNLISPIRKKIRTQWRFNCTSFIQYFIENHIFSYDKVTQKIDRNFQTISQWVKEQDEKYIEYFFKGYFETEYKKNEIEPKVELKDLLFINDNYINQFKPRKLIKKAFPTISSNKQEERNKKNRKVDFIRKNIKDTEIGLMGELYVYQEEYNKLKEFEKNGLIESVEDVLFWVSKIDDSAGYDIKSYDPIAKKTIFIEVKTTSSSANTPFYITENELQFSKNNSKNYKLYRLFNFSKENTKEIEYFEIEGNLQDNSYLAITPKTYEVRIKL